MIPSWLEPCRRWIHAVIVIAVACSRNPGRPPSAKAEWQRGDVAVVEPTAADFYESQVVEVLPGQLRVQRLGGGDSLLVSIADAYRIPSVAPSRIATAPWAICRVRSHEWVACRVNQPKSISPGDAAVFDRPVNAAEGVQHEGVVVEHTGAEHPLAETMLIEPSGLTAMNIQRRFEQSARRSNFERAFRGNMRPRHAANWQPMTRRSVLASRQGQWFGAQVIEIEKDRLTVRFDGDKAQLDLNKTEVAPQPPFCGQLGRGDRALRRPTGPGGPWLPVLVVNVDGADAVVEDVDRSRTTLQTRDLCPLSPTTPESQEPTSKAP
jgi:hypothetical protein